MENSFQSESSDPKGGLPENPEPSLHALRLRTQRFFELEGRRPRVLVGALQRQEGTYSAERLGALMAEMGFDVDLQPVLMPADHLAAIALDNDVHAVVVLGVSSAAEPQLRDLIRALASGGGGNIILALDHMDVCDSLRQGGDRPLVWLSDAGVASASRLLGTIERRH
jgi:methylmalonyl-CoA mutase cobalamin-binding domain/chain